MNNEGIQRVRTEFLKYFPEFQDFEHPPQAFSEGEIDYKQVAAKKARSILGEYVAGHRDFATDQEARNTVIAVIELTNFFTWRGTAYLDEELCTEDGDWMRLARLLMGCLRGADAGKWEQPLQELLDWLNSKACRASISKLLPTNFLFLWKPQEHFSIKTRFVDRFLKLLGETPLGQGKPLTVDGYQHVLRACQEFRDGISDWKPRDNVDVHSLAWLVTGGWSDVPGFEGISVKAGVSEHPEGKIENVAIPPVQRPNIPLNLILAGPPGTGKTYALLTKYVPLFEEYVAQQSLEEFAFERCAELSWHETCVIGLRLLGHPATVQQLVETDPVKARMKLRANKKYVTNTLWVGMANHTPEDCNNVSVDRHCEPAMFWKNKDPTWQLVDEIEQIAPELITLADEIRNYQPASTLVRRHEFVTFHQSYSYEDFVEGIKPEMSLTGTEGEAGQVQYTVQPGIFARMVRRAIADPERSYALFIDEINRANISNVFGELITLLEPDKRMRFDRARHEWLDGVQTKLPYTHSMQPQEPLFGVPDNLYVIGTMNSADRSIALLDLALRRRFTFDEYMPDPSLLAASVVTEDGEEIQLDKLLDVINQRIEYLYDRDHTVGHSYLMGITTLEGLERAFRQKILPLLQEYFYGDWHKIQLVLGDLVPGEEVDYRANAHPHAIVSHVVQRPKQLFGLDDEAYQDRRSYAISDELSAESFRKVYQNPSLG